MRLGYTPKFSSNFRKLSKSVQKKFYKQVSFLFRDLRHPSLHAKKYDESRSIWQARVDQEIRFIF